MDANIIAVATIGGALALGAMSPGPSFIMVARTAVASSRRAGMGAALGMGSGALVISLIALMGLHTLLLAVPWLWLLLKTGGGLYLLWMAFKMFRHAREPLHVVKDSNMGKSFRRAFLTAFVTQISNPKTAVVFAGVFAALLPGHITPAMYVALPVVAMLVDGLWYAFVAWALSSSGPRNTYLRYGDVRPHRRQRDGRAGHQADNEVEKAGTSKADGACGRSGLLWAVFSVERWYRGGDGANFCDAESASGKGAGFCGAGNAL